MGKNRCCFGAALILASAALVPAGCRERCPIWSPEGTVIQRNLMYHIQLAFQRTSSALAEGRTNDAYASLSHLSTLFKLVPVESPEHKEIVDNALRSAERAMAALRIHDIFAARDAARGLGTSCMACHAIRGRKPAAAKPAQPSP